MEYYSTIADEMMAEADENLTWEYVVIHRGTGRAVSPHPTEALAIAHIRWTLRDPDQKEYRVVHITS